MSAYLALDTSQHALSIALYVNDVLHEHHQPCTAAEQSLRLLPAIEALMAEAAVDYQHLDGILVGLGPGRFMGVRQSLALMQGVALARDLPVAGYSSLWIAALAVESSLESEQLGDPLTILVAYDARMGEVYWAGYQRDEQGDWAVRQSPSVDRPAVVLQEISGWQAGSWVMLGDQASVQLKEACSASLGAVKHMVVEAPRAADLLRYLQKPGLAAVDWKPAGHWQPFYVRQQVAHKN